MYVAWYSACVCASVALLIKSIYLSNILVIPASCEATIYLKVLFDKDAHIISNETHNVLMCAMLIGAKLIITIRQSTA